MSYFKPLRRKIGVITLVMACSVALAWVRSLLALDVVAMSVGEHEVVGFMTGSGCSAFVIAYLENVARYRIL
jgi:hypothetical protein